MCHCCDRVEHPGTCLGLSSSTARCDLETSGGIISHRSLSTKDGTTPLLAQCSTRASITQQRCSTTRVRSEAGPTRYSPGLSTSALRYSTRWKALLKAAIAGFRSPRAQEPRRGHTNMAPGLNWPSSNRAIGWTANHHCGLMLAGSTASKLRDSFSYSLPPPRQRHASANTDELTFPGTSRAGYRRASENALRL